MSARASDEGGARVAYEVMVVTGAGAGLGRAIARRFGRPGVALGLLGRDPGRLADACKEAEDAGAAALAIPLDVANADAVERAAAAVEERFGPIDVWINNAMVSVFAPVHLTSADEFRRVTEVTYLGVVHGTLAALARMRPRNRGVIVQVGSALAYRGVPLQAAYCGAKHAIQGFCDSLRCELRHDRIGVHVAMVQMPALDTPQFDWSRSRMPNRAQPVPPIYDPALGAAAVEWAITGRRREVWLGWSTVIAILSDRLAPALADRYLARNGYASQQTGEAEDPDRCENLLDACAGPYGARGRFADRTRSFSTQFWMSQHRWAVALLSGAALCRILVSYRRHLRGNRLARMARDRGQPVAHRGGIRARASRRLGPRAE